MSHYDDRYRAAYGNEAGAYDASRYGSLRGSHSRRAKNDAIMAVLEAEGLHREETRIIDVATGTGRIAHELARGRFSHVDSADITPEMLRVSRESLDPKYRHKLSWIAADMKDLPLPDGTFDVVTVGSFFYLIPQEEYSRYVRDVWRILKPNGLFICEVSNAIPLFSPINLISIAFHKWWKRRDVKSYIAPWDVHRLFAGFALEDVVGIEYPMLTRRYGLYRHYSRLLGSLRITKCLGGKYLLVYRKNSDG